MKIKADDGGYNRSVLFHNPECFEGHYTLTTWFNHLCISGDYGTFVFQRTDDMFKFFRDKRINPRYWGEKLQSESRWGGYKKYDHELFKANILDYADQQIDELDDDQKAEVIQQIKEDIFYYCDDNEVRAYDAAMEFDNEHVDFQDFFEFDNTEYTSREYPCSTNLNRM